MVQRAFITAIVLAFATLAATAEIMPTVPFRWQRGKVESMVRDLRDIHERTGLSRFYLAGPGFDEVMYKPFAPDLYAEMGREIGAVRQALEPLGLEINWWCSPSIRYVSAFAPLWRAQGPFAQMGPEFFVFRKSSR